MVRLIGFAWQRKNTVEPYRSPYMDAGEIQIKFISLHCHFILGICLKILMILLMLLFCLPAAMAETDDSKSIEATTALTLPVDSVTIYPGGLMAVKRVGSMDVTEGVHKFVINLPAKADKGSALLSVSNATQERVVYESSPVYTLNISQAGGQSFLLSYLMLAAASWQPRYDLHLTNDDVLVRANAVVRNLGGEDLKDVRLKLVAGLPASQPSPLAKASRRRCEAMTQQLQLPPRQLWNMLWRAHSSPQVSWRRFISSSWRSERTWSWTKR